MTRASASSQAPADGWPAAARVAAVFGVASAGLAVLEVGLLRLGSLYFAADLTHAQLGLALFGLAIGAAWAARSRVQRPRALPAALAWAGALAAAATLALPRSDLAWAIGVGAWPFAAFGYASGVAWVGPWRAVQRRWLYAAELAGALVGIGVLAPICVGWRGGAGLLAVGALVLGSAAVACRAALPPAASPHDGRARRGSGILGGAGALALATAVVASAEEPLPTSVGVQRHLDVAVAAEGLVALETRHSLWARTDRLRTRNDDALQLYTDAMTVARAPRWDGLAPRFASARLQAQATLRRVALDGCSGVALVVGAGAGFDVAVALQQGVANVVAVEVNPDLVALARDADPAFSAVFRHPGVRWIEGDGRRVAASLEGGFGCILLGLVETAPASLHRAGRVDGRLLTVEAMQTWRRLLTPEGRLAVLHNEDELGHRSAATAAEVFGQDAVQSFALPAPPSENPARVLVVASAAAQDRSATRQAAVAAGAVDVAAATGATAIHDARPALRSGNPVPLTALALVLAAVAAAMSLAAGRRLRRAAATIGAVGAIASGRSWVAALLAGFGGAALQMVAIERATAAIGSPAVAQPVALAAALAGAALGGAWLTPPDDTAIGAPGAGSGVGGAGRLGAARGGGWFVASAAAWTLSVGGEALVAAALPWPGWAAAACLAGTTLAAAMATGAAWLAAIESVPASARPVVLAWDGVGALIAAAATALAVELGGLAILGSLAWLALAAASLAGLLRFATVPAPTRSPEVP